MSIAVASAPSPGWRTPGGAGRRGRFAGGTGTPTSWRTPAAARRRGPSGWRRCCSASPPASRASAPTRAWPSPTRPTRASSASRPRRCALGARSSRSSASRRWPGSSARWTPTRWWRRPAPATAPAPASTSAAGPTARCCASPTRRCPTAAGSPRSPTSPPSARRSARRPAAPPCSRPCSTRCPWASRCMRPTAAWRWSTRPTTRSSPTAPSRRARTSATSCCAAPRGAISGRATPRRRWRPSWPTSTGRRASSVGGPRAASPSTAACRSPTAATPCWWRTRPRSTPRRPRRGGATRCSRRCWRARATASPCSTGRASWSRPTAWPRPSAACRTARSPRARASTSSGECRWRPASTAPRRTRAASSPTACRCRCAARTATSAPPRAGGWWRW